MSLKHGDCNAFGALPLPDRAFLHSSAAGAFRGQIFCRFSRFWCVFGGPVGAFLVQIVVKKVLRKKSAKMSENGSRGELQPGPAGSLKQENRQLQTREQTAPDLRRSEKARGVDRTRFLCLKARWRIMLSSSSLIKINHH